MMRKQTRDPIQPIEIIRDVPRDLNELCMKLLCRDPEGRPAGREVLRALGARTSEALSASFLATTKEPHFLGRTRQLAERRKAFAALREWLTRVASQQPLVIYVDGVQWGDADSLFLLEDFLQPRESPPLLVAGSCRAEDIESTLFLKHLLRPTRTETCREL